jgi:hypothetical protein
MNWYSQERKIVEKWVCLFSQMEIYRTKQKQKQEKKSNTSNVLAIINATVNGAESATGYDALDDELGGVNLPLVPGDSGRCFLFLFSVLVLLHSPCPAQMPLKLLVQALQIYLIRAAGARGMKMRKKKRNGREERVSEIRAQDFNNQKKKKKKKSKKKK